MVFLRRCGNDQWFNDKDFDKIKRTVRYVHDCLFFMFDNVIVNRAKAICNGAIIDVQPLNVNSVFYPMCYCKSLIDQFIFNYNDNLITTSYSLENISICTPSKFTLSDIYQNSTNEWFELALGIESSDNNHLKITRDQKPIVCQRATRL